MPSPYRTDPCGSTSTSSVFTPRRASETARLIAVVVFPTPPFWLTIASTRPTLWLRFLRDRVHARSQIVECFLRMAHPPLGFGARRRFGEERLEMLFGALPIAPLQEQEGEPVVRSGQLRRDLECPTIAANRVVQPTGVRE